MEDYGSESSEAVIIGGMVLDIHATPSVKYVPGGVARNIAECLSKLGAKPYMISALGEDMAGNMLLDYWNWARLSTKGIKKQSIIKTPVVCNVLDVNGELAAGVADVEAVEKHLTPEWIRCSKSIICSAPVVMVDANLSPSALGAPCWMAAEAGIPLWFEPVSVAKSRRVTSVVKYITFASPNEDELIAMANALSGRDAFNPIQKDNAKTKCSPESLFQMLKPAILVLLDKGVKIVIVTIGSNGVFLCSKGQSELLKNGFKRSSRELSQQLYKLVSSTCPSNRFFNDSEYESSQLYAVHFPALPASVVRLTGAGDCLVGGMLASLCAGLNVMQSVAVGVAAAKAAVETHTNVPARYSPAEIADNARLVYSSSKILFQQSKL
ncbi:Carbohydrate kinase PfkB [Dillenia turbinata]|uniref:Carbohydrate kinase PfkB n=1 Tax=Dillenia turbinata TaxID=194707 RepID=A0AAN8YVE1_9MAGN